MEHIQCNAHRGGHQKDTNECIQKTLHIHGGIYSWECEAKGNTAPDCDDEPQPMRI